MDERNIPNNCLFCGAEVPPDGNCPQCRFHFEMTARGPKIGEREWNMAFGSRDPRQQFRDPLTRAVQDALHEYHGGSEVPHARLRKLVALLIDLHCHQEGIIIGLTSALNNYVHPRPAYPTYPPSRPPRRPDPSRDLRPGRDPRKMRG